GVLGRLRRLLVRSDHAIPAVTSLGGACLELILAVEERRHALAEERHRREEGLYHGRPRRGSGVIAGAAPPMAIPRCRSRSSRVGCTIPLADRSASTSQSTRRRSGLRIAPWSTGARAAAGLSTRKRRSRRTAARVFECVAMVFQRPVLSPARRGEP